jgi:hypothetical protein
MTRHILLTLTILAGLAAAPSAQPFSWEAGGAGDWSDRHLDDGDGRRTIAGGRPDGADGGADGRARQSSAGTRGAPGGVVGGTVRGARRDADAPDRAAGAPCRAVRASAERVTRTAGRGGWSRAHWRRPVPRDGTGDRDGYRHCEVREQRLPGGALTVDAGPNGGIRVEAWDGNDILVRAVVQARGATEAEARQRASAVAVEASGGRVSARGPTSDGNRWWSVSYRVSVPRQTDLQLNARNGGITIVGVAGAITLRHHQRRCAAGRPRQGASAAAPGTAG